MIKISVTIASVLTFSFFAIGQTENEYYILNDGSKLGKKSILLDGCVKQEGMSAAYTDPRKVCDCMYSLIAKHHNEAEIDKVYGKEGGNYLTYLFLNGKLNFRAEVEACTLPFIRGDYNVSQRGRRIDSLLYVQCKIDIKPYVDNKQLNIDLDSFCTCFVENHANEEMTFGEIENIDEHSVLANEAILHCINYATIDSSISLNLNDVSGPNKTEKIKLIRYAGGYKIKLKIGSVSKYFIFDTGATHTIISSKTESELLSKGIIDEDAYQGEATVKIADGSLVQCRVLQLNGVKLGSFTVDNVIIAVMEGDVPLLFGKSILDKFEKWTIVNNTDMLHLTVR